MNRPDEKIFFSNIDPLIANLSRKSEHLREEAAFELRHAGGPRVVEALLATLADPVAKVRAVALDSLSHMDLSNREPISEAAIRLLDDPDDEVKLAAAKTLGRMGSEAAVDKLIALVSHERPNVRLYAALALGRTRSERATAPLAELFVRETDKKVRATCIMALGFTGNRKVVPLLVQQGITDEDRRVRASAVESLAHFKYNDKDRFRVIEIIREKCMHDEDNRVKGNAIMTLHRLGDLEATSHLTGMGKSPVKWLRASAAYVCGMIGTPETTDTLFSLVKDPESDVRLNVVRAMARIGSARMVDHLVDYIGDPDETVRREAYLAFGQLRNPKAVFALNKLLAHKNDVFRYLAAQGIRNLKDKSSFVPLLDAHLKERNDEVKALLWSCAAAIARLTPLAAIDVIRFNKPKEVQKAALELTADADPALRKQILESAGQSKWKEIAAPAIEALYALNKPA